MQFITKQELLQYLKERGNPFVSFVYWNNQSLSVDEAVRRARGLTEDVLVARWGKYIYSSSPSSCLASVPITHSEPAPSLGTSI